MKTELSTEQRFKLKIQRADIFKHNLAFAILQTGAAQQNFFFGKEKLIFCEMTIKPA
jgi:hypothetical protein